MKFTVITLFPEMFEGVFNHSILKRAQREEKVVIEIVNLRDFGIGAHKTVDDKPYGGGVGMVLRVDVLESAIKSVKTEKTDLVILLDPKGEVYKQSIVEKLSKLNHVVLICGHYEGYDERIRNFVDMEISIGDYVMSGGEIPAMVVVESVSRLIKGVLKHDEATSLESFSKNIKTGRILEHAQHTRPAIYKGFEVPHILKSGNPKLIEEWKMKNAESLTKKRRPELLKKPTR